MIHDITQWANQKWERNGAEKCWNGNGSPMLQQEEKGQRQKYIFMKTRLCPRVFLIHNWIRVSRVKNENGGEDAMIFCITRMIWKKCFLALHVWLIQALNELTAPEKRLTILSLSPAFTGKSNSFFVLLIIHNIWWCFTYLWDTEHFSTRLWWKK